MNDWSPAVDDFVFGFDIEGEIPLRLNSGNDVDQFPFDEFEATCKRDNGYNISIEWYPGALYLKKAAQNLAFTNGCIQCNDILMKNTLFTVQIPLQFRTRKNIRGEM